MKKNEEESIGVYKLMYFTIVIIATTISVAMSSLYFGDFGFQTPEDGMLNGSYSSPIWNITQTYNLSIGEQYISDKLDFFFFIVITGILLGALWTMLNFVNCMAGIEWSTLKNKVEKICYTIEYIVGIMVFFPAIAYFGWQIEITFIMPVVVYIFVACIIIELAYDGFIFKGGRK